MLKENTIAIGVLLVAIIVLMFKQGSDTMQKLHSIELSTARLLDSVEPLKATAPVNSPQLARQRTPFQPIVYQWPGETQSLTPVTLDLQDWSQPADTDPSDTIWGKETDRRLSSLEQEFKQSSQRLDSIETRVKQLELMFATSLKSTPTTAKQTKAKATDFELLSVDDQPAPAPAQVFIEQPQIQYVQPVYYSSPLTYGSTGSYRSTAAAPAYGYTQSSGQYTQSFGQSPQHTATRVVRRPVQQYRTTSYGPVLGTRLGSRVGNFFGQDCPGGVCPQ